MLRHKRSTDDEPSQRYENAWRLHAAQMEWTGKVDAKAAFALTVQAALLGAVVVLLEDMKSGLEYTLLGASAVLVLAGAVFAAAVVAPQLRGRKLGEEAKSNFIFFGHARLWKPERLARELKRSDLVDQLAQQVVVMADIAWKKHRRVAWSIWLGLAGGALLLASVAVSRI
ncbi:hypothetical protein EDD26_0180 [Agrococcus jenensis]|uniref:Pycsar effector protein domain-containing protein n=2 Tax=Agrococcus jenensis TaxID=46353 RepID=A0A3N2AP54_9MICO|nr:hypothetical protein EDD26_0180 [Agrococcus jenensis]